MATITVHIPPSMGEPFTLTHQGRQSLAELLAEQAPTILEKIITKENRVNHFVSVYLDKEKINDLQVIPTTSLCRLDILIALSGG